IASRRYAGKTVSTVTRDGSRRRLGQRTAADCDCAKTDNVAVVSLDCAGNQPAVGEDDILRGCEQARGEVSKGRWRNHPSLVVSGDQRESVNRYCKRAAGIVNC